MGLMFFWFAPASPAWSLGLLTPSIPLAAGQVIPGQSSDQVIANLGKPDQIVDFGKQVIYAYGNRRIVFTNGKVTDAGAGEERATKQNRSQAQKRENGPSAAIGPACQAADGESVRDEIHGQIRIEAGSGSFAAISPSHKDIWVTPGSSLSGWVRLHVLNGGKNDAVTPLIGAVSWGDPSRTFWSVSPWVHSGSNNLSAVVNSIAPREAGTYHIVFAMQVEKNSADVASATDWGIHRDRWNDGNDLARMSPKQIQQAQREGCTTDKWLTTSGYEPIAVPADAITVHVGVRPASSRSTSQ